MESKAARNFNSYMEAIGVKQVVYLSGIVNHNELSKHLQSRKNVETILFEGNFNINWSVIFINLPIIIIINKLSNRIRAKVTYFAISDYQLFQNFVLFQRRT